MTTTPLSLDPSTLASFLIGTVLPLLIAWLQSRYASSRYKAAFSFAVCVGVAVIITVLTKGYSGSWGASAADNAQLVMVNIVALLFTAWQMFARFWTPLGTVAALEARGPQLGAIAPASPPT